MNDQQLMVNSLCRRLQYEFSDQNLLQQAITHRSKSSQHNERLEFLGDSILGFVAAEILYSRFDNIPEGSLTRLRAKLVRRETLALVARDLELGDYLSLGIGEAKSGGQNRDSILADALEAVIGAIYLDGGMTSARDFILTTFRLHLDQLDPEQLDKDPKTRLQEFLQQKGSPIPKYKVSEVSGPSHDQHFVVQCIVDDDASDNGEMTYLGEGSSRRKAEQLAAETALNALTNTQ
ncbi:MAG: ribonuclease III [Gammaproteobacteria bacterium]|nr:ribonuclease III [Gammaproteobacteria bacterium]